MKEKLFNDSVNLYICNVTLLRVIRCFRSGWGIHCEEQLPS